MEITQSEQVRELRLEEILDISSAQTLYADIKRLMNGDGELIIDGSAVSKIDTASMQVLIAAFAHAEVNERVIALRSPSEILTKSATLLGVGELIGLHCDK